MLSDLMFSAEVRGVASDVPSPLLLIHFVLPQTAPISSLGAVAAAKPPYACRYAAYLQRQLWHLQAPPDVLSGVRSEACCPYLCASQSTNECCLWSALAQHQNFSIKIGMLKRNWAVQLACRCRRPMMSTTSVQSLCIEARMAISWWTCAALGI